MTGVQTCALPIYNRLVGRYNGRYLADKKHELAEKNLSDVRARIKPLTGILRDEVGAVAGAAAGAAAGWVVA